MDIPNSSLIEEDREYVVDTNASSALLQLNLSDSYVSMFLFLIFQAISSNVFI